MSSAEKAPGNPLLEALEQRSVIVCVGAGGVGKTTISAALALEAARLGKSALVCTIDPARRLANSLGLDALGNTESQVPEAKWKSAGLTAKAPLFAMMLDMKQSWDELINRYAPPDKRARILENRFYQALSSALAGSQEYISLEKLWELQSGRAYGLIVLDTPPTAHALDFLEAPDRILDFLDNDAAKWLLTPALAAGKLGLQLFNLGGSYVAKTLARFTGGAMLQELATFMLAIGGLNENFRERARAVRGLLAAEETAFVLVTTPNPERMDEAVHFFEVLRAQKMRVAAVVVNRVHSRVLDSDRAAADALPDGLRQKMKTTLDELALLAAQDARALATLAARVSPVALVEVPLFPLDVHDLAGLHASGEYLLGERTVEGSQIEGSQIAP